MLFAFRETTAMRENSATKLRAERNVGADTINAAYDTVHAGDQPESNDYEHPYECMDLGHTLSETNIDVA